jgi:hypothetical protein
MSAALRRGRGSLPAGELDRSVGEVDVRFRLIALLAFVISALIAAAIGVSEAMRDTLHAREIGGTDVRVVVRPTGSDPVGRVSYRFYPDLEAALDLYRCQEVEASRLFEPANGFDGEAFTARMTWLSRWTVLGREFSYVPYRFLVLDVELRSGQKVRRLIELPSHRGVPDVAVYVP